MKKEVKFQEGTSILHVPYRPNLKIVGEGVYEEMYEELDRYKVPKGTRSIDVIHRVYVDLEDTQLSHTSSVVSFYR